MPNKPSTKPQTKTVAWGFQHLAALCCILGMLDLWPTAHAAAPAGKFAESSARTFQCGHEYRDTPCPPDKPGSYINVDDARTPAQRKQQEIDNAKSQADGKKLEKSRLREEASAHTHAQQVLKDQAMAKAKADERAKQLARKNEEDTSRLHKPHLSKPHLNKPKKIKPNAADGDNFLTKVPAKN